MIRIIGEFGTVNVSSIDIGVANLSRANGQQRNHYRHHHHHHHLRYRGIRLRIVEKSRRQPLGYTRTYICIYTARLTRVNVLFGALSTFFKIAYLCLTHSAEHLSLDSNRPHEPFHFIKDAWSTWSNSLLPLGT